MRSAKRRQTTIAIAVAALAALALSAPASAPARSDASLEVYQATVPRDQLAAIAAEGYDVAAARERAAGASVDLVLSSAERARLSAQGVELELVRDASGRTVQQRAAQQAAGGFDVFRDYDGTGGIREQLYELEAQNPDFVDLRVIGTSVEGREIIAMRVTDDVDETPTGSRPSVLYQGTTHAREWISTEVTMRLLENFAARAGDDGSEIHDLVETRELWFVPVLNPDGYQYTFDSERLWRKNLRDNDGDGEITISDGVDLNRNYPERWNYDDEGSESATSGETYRGPSPASEPETQADINLFEDVDFTFVNSYHSYARLLLYAEAWQVQTPSRDDPVLIALSGTDQKPAIEGYDPDLGAELYTVNGDFVEWAHGDQEALAWTTELSAGCRGCGFVFPDDEGRVQEEYRKNRPFALDLARSAADPANPDSHLGNETQPFYLNVAELDRTRRHNPGSDFRFTKSYGDPQQVQVLASREIGAVTLHFSVNGGPEQTAPTSEWEGGERWGENMDVHYHEMRGTVTGTNPGDEVEVWFEGGGEESDRFSYDAVSETGNEVLVVAAEDYSGIANSPKYEDRENPSYLSYFTDALDAGGHAYDVYDVDAEGRRAPDALGVLAHYDAVVHYTANDIITREPGQQPGTASRLANDEMLELRAYVNEGGKLLLNGQFAGYQYAFAYAYDPVRNRPCFAGKPAVDARCLLLSDDFLQYYLGAYTYNDDAGTEDGRPLDVDGVEDPYNGAAWRLNGGDSARNQDHTASFLSTSSLLPEADYPQFASDGPAEYLRADAAPFEPFDGSRYVYSGRADNTYKRLERDLDLSALDSGDDASLSFQTSYDTEPRWDFVFVEAHRRGRSNWTTLPDVNGHTSRNVGLSCPFSDITLDHPFLRHYMTPSGDGSCANAGTTGSWNAGTGRSAGWEEWEIDLSDYAGKRIGLSITYVSDAGVQGVGAFVDQIETSTGEGTTSFENDADPMDGWRIPGSASSSLPNANDWERTGSLGLEEGAVVSTEDTLYFGFGFEGIPTAVDRNDVMARSIDYLIGGP